MNIPNLKPIPHRALADHMPVSEFRLALSTGELSPESGNGFFATSKGYSALRVFTEVGVNACPSWATHVLWFNK